MPVACANCGTQNPDENRFCQSCGRPLVAVPAAATPPAAPAPVPGPPPLAPFPAASQPGAYQTPYYTPTGSGPPTHRIPVAGIIGIIIALAVVMTGCGVVAAAFVNRDHTKPSISPPPQPSPVQPQPTTSPVPQPSASPAPQPSGSPAPQPSSSPAPQPSASPLPSSSPPQPSPPSGDQVCSDAACASAANGFAGKVDNGVLTFQRQGDAGLLLIAALSQNSQVTLQDVVNAIVSGTQNKYPDTKTCSAAKESTTGGVQGVLVALCYTVSANGQSIPVADVYFIGVNSAGSVAYFVEQLETVDKINDFQTATGPTRQSITWKLR